MIPKIPPPTNIAASPYGSKSDCSQAIHDFNDALRLDPGNGAIHGERGVMFDRKGEPGKALDDYNENLRLNPGGMRPPMGYCGAIHFKHGRLDQALADFTEAVRLDPADAQNFAHRAAVYDRRRSYALAIADFTRGPPRRKARR